MQIAYVICFFSLTNTSNMNNPVINDEQTSQVALEDTVIDGNFLTDCLKRQMESMLEQSTEAQLEQLDFSTFPTAIKSPAVWVKNPDGVVVSKVNDVIALLQALSELTQIETYSGHDHAEVFLLNGVLPEKYTAQVRNVMVRHVPTRLFEEGKIVAAEMKPFGKAPRGKKKLVLRGVAGGAIRTDSAWENVPRKEIARHYHNVTVKITRDTQRLVAWFPGLDIHSNVCEGLEGAFVEMQESSEYIQKPAQKADGRLRFSDLR